MRQRQSLRLRNQAKKARIQRMAKYLRDIDARNATKPRQSLRLLIKITVAPYPVILFGEEDFWPDDPAEERLLPPDGFRIICDDSGETDEDDTSTLTTEDDSVPDDVSSSAASINSRTSDSGTNNTSESAHTWHQISDASS